MRDAISPREPSVAEHFRSMEEQAHAARLGMWIFLASEILLFAGLFALFGSYRLRDPAGFEDAIHHNTKTFGSVNTGVLLMSSYFAASAVHMVRKGRRGLAILLTSCTILLGGVFLVIKIVEYGNHFREGIYPALALSHARAHGAPEFWNLYFTMTGLHAIHVTAGMLVLAGAIWSIARGKASASAPQRMEVSALYWHLVDTVWIFLWPLFYLA